ncbi:MAG: citrate lyase holo-[acyl-carrier protein] synthase [Prevotella sp.]|nr:citrate lyase holo-[acyl-carrier protein] synthase [Prevotella sp.]MCM1075080.1 citrate lyase holo-[acyl-carrier protein] synthase [Ruminococcus sp.]
MGITLTQLLESRDNRRERQLCLLSQFPQKSLIVLTINIPGAEKRTDSSLVIARAGHKAILKALGDKLIHEEHSDLPTGWESYFLTELSAEQAKTIAIDIENSHPLGRLMDIDVIGNDGVPLSRRFDGMPSRRCLICDDDARACMRSQKHSVEELTAKIKGLTDEYLRRL